MEAKDILLIVLPLATAVIGYYLSKKKELELRISEEKRKRYENLITYLRRGFMDASLPADEKIRNKKDFYEQSYIVWLYASDEVIGHINDFARAFAKHSDQKSKETEATVNKTLKDLVRAMRKDTRGKTKLKAEDFVTTTVQSRSNTQQSPASNRLKAPPEE